MGNEILIVGRTDALSSRVIDSNHDKIDQPYILGQVDPKNPANLMTFPEAGVAAIKSKFQGSQMNDVLAKWNAKCYDLGLLEAHAFA
jgi:isocitrate lyase